MRHSWSVIGGPPGCGCRLSVALNVYLLVVPLQFHVKPRLVLIYAFILPIRFSSTFQHYPPAKRRQVLLVACYLKCLAAVPIPEPANPVHHEDLPRSSIGRTRGGRKLVSGEISSGAVPSVHFALHAPSTPANRERNAASRLVLERKGDPGSKRCDFSIFDFHIHFHNFS
jgi:hypothetical protein